jgi:hypothetical protein
VLSKQDLKKFEESVSRIIKKDVPPMIEAAIDKAFGWKLPEYETKKEHDRDMYKVDRKIASLQDTLIGVNSYIQQEFPIFRRDLDEVKADVKKLDSRMDGLENRMGGLEGRMDRLEGKMDILLAR